MVNLQRVGFLAAFPALLARFGVSAEEVLVAAGLAPRALDNPESTIPFEAAGQLLRIATERTKCAHLGLDIGQGITTSSLGLVGSLMRHSPDVRTALRYFVIHQHRNAHGGVVYLRENASEAKFGYAVYHPGLPGQDVISDAAMMAAHKLIRELAGHHAQFTKVLFSRHEPRDLAPYKLAFATRLCFESEQNALVVPNKVLDSPIAKSDAETRAGLLSQIESTWTVGEFDLETQVRRELRVALLDGHTSIENIAERIGMMRWTLERRLTASGVSFQQLLNESRCEFTKQLLENTGLDIARISKIVGYSDPSVLTRAFTRWTGRTPRAWRTANTVNH